MWRGSLSVTIPAMDPDELIARLSQPSENSPATEDVAALIGLFQTENQARQHLAETSEAAVQQLSTTNEAQAAEIQRLKALNYDLMTRQPGIPQEPPANEQPKPRGIAALFEGKKS